VSHHQGIAICRTPEDLEEMCLTKAMATAKFAAGKRLGWSLKEMDFGM
jgi:hypothetical protein